MSTPTLGLSQVMLRCVALAGLLLALLAAVTQAPAVSADHTPTPTSVTIAGSFQSELGCPGDWQPDCTTTHLTYDADDDLWQGTFTIPADNYQYKAAINNSWGENYGANATPGGADIPLSLSADTAVKFYYDHDTHWVTSNQNSVIATVAGSFQSELGCPGDWSPDCLRSWMQDPDGDGKYTFTTTNIPIGNYEFKVALNEGWAESYPGSNQSFSVTTPGERVTINFDAATKQISFGDVPGNLKQAAAHWLKPDVIAWNVPSTADSVMLHYDPDGGLALEATGVGGGESFALTAIPGGLDPDTRALFPHLASFQAWSVPQAARDRIGELLQDQVVVSAENAAGALLDATGLQLPGVLDELYANDTALGVVYSGAAPTLRVWAPTAKSVTLRLFDDASTTSYAAVPMTRDSNTGVWSASGQADWTGKYYLYEVEVFVRATGQVETNVVTDPYSISLALNSTRSQIVDLNDPSLKPKGWDALAKPTLAAPEDIVLYELHVRDFSATDASVPEVERGTFRAFTRKDANGMRHLRELSKAGLTHIHLLPANDCASINEQKSEWQAPDPAVLATYPPNSDQQQQAVNAVRDEDGFNWCYDPYHFTAPEGSYATDPNGPQRILEFREMVQALSDSGLRVVMDVVYNHTAQSGLGDKSVLDKVVPGYYHRLSLEGNVETSTCCQNTATEHQMMEKLMVDSLVTWATAYKVDGFRFDLMGHHMKRNMEKARDRLQALTPAQDGVDGSAIYLYGEGWNFGEVANNARGVNATQINMGGTGIGTFNDRIRDGVRGGGPFDNVMAIIENQGFVNGLYYDPNAANQGDAAELARLRLYQDWIQVGMAGNLADYSFVDRTGATVTGAQVDYNGQPTGYTQDPQEVINYVEAHDNQTLFDIIQYKAPLDTPMADRVRIQNLGNDIVMLGQGVPFFHAGQDMLRSKSLDRNSYNSGDWFNKLDWTYTSNNWGVGLPIPEGETAAERQIQSDLLGNPALKPAQADILAAVEHFREVLRIRKSSPLFRLQTADEINARLRYFNTGPNAIPGMLVFGLSDTVDGRADLDRKYEYIVVIVNANDEPQTFANPDWQSQNFKLHPVLADSTDDLVQTATFAKESGTFSVPARTTAVFLIQNVWMQQLPMVFTSRP